MSRISDRYMHFCNECVLDCLEVSEDEKVPPEALYKLGEIKQYGDGSREFYWKGRLMILFPPPFVDELEMLNVEAILVYDDDRAVNMSEHNKGV